MWTRAMFSWQQINLSLRKSLRIWYASHLISTKMTCVSHIDIDTLRSTQSKMVYKSSRNSKCRGSVSNAKLCTVLAKLVPANFFFFLSQWQNQQNMLGITVTSNDARWLDESVRRCILYLMRISSDFFPPKNDKMELINGNNSNFHLSRDSRIWDLIFFWLVENWCLFLDFASPRDTSILQSLLLVLGKRAVINCHLSS